MKYYVCPICKNRMVNQDDVDGTIHCRKHGEQPLTEIEGQIMTTSAQADQMEGKTETPRTDALREKHVILIQNGSNLVDSAFHAITELEALAGDLEKELSEANAKIALLQSGQWQDISTAPRDGKCLLWVDTDNGGEVMKLDREKDGTWMYDNEPLCCAPWFANPTHWAPLPPAPKQGSEG